VPSTSPSVQPSPSVSEPSPSSPSPSFTGRHRWGHGGESHEGR
jgi:hypothetical protein